LAKLTTRLGAIGLQGNVVGQRMADEAHRHLMLGIELRLEGEQGEHQVAGVANLEYTLLTPGPHRGADVVDGLEAGLA
jgi:hypothetical protein